MNPLSPRERASGAPELAKRAEVCAGGEGYDDASATLYLPIASSDGAPSFSRGEKDL
jgi:hypothetical protein